MSQRKTRSAPETVLGVPFYGSEYTDPRHAEFDAGGTNVGLVNPNTPIYETPYPGLPPIEDTSPLWINGQRVTATLDGMAISWQMVRNLLDHGAAVPVGIDNIFRAARGRDINVRYTGSGRYTFRDFTYDGPGSRYIGVTFDFSFNFGTQLQSHQREYLRQLDKTEVSKLRPLVSDLVKNEKCAKFIEELLDTAQEIVGPDSYARSERLYTHDILDIFDRVAEDGGFFTGGSGANTIRGTLDYGLLLPNGNTLSGEELKPRVLLS